MSDTYPRALLIPLYGLFHVKDPTAFPGLSKQQREALLRDYSTEEITGIADALNWAAARPDYPYETLLPGLPYSRETIYRYLMAVRDSIPDRSDADGDAGE